MRSCHALQSGGTSAWPARAKESRTESAKAMEGFGEKSRQVYGRRMAEQPGGDGKAKERLSPRSKLARPVRQEVLPIDVPPPRVPRGGRRPFSESREELIRRLLDPELTLHEASLILNVSKATLRRHADEGKLRCTRTGGGHRRFKLSDLLELVEGG